MTAPTSKFVNVNGIRMHYLDWGGTGPTVVFQHGTGLSGGVWEPIVKRIGGKLRCITPDLRSHGDTERSTIPITWELLGQDMAEFYKAVGLHDAMLVAHSRGGGVGFLAAGLTPERFGGAYFIEPALLRPARGTEPPPSSDADKQRRPDPAEQARRRKFQFASKQEAVDAHKGRGAFKLATDELLWAYINHGTKLLPDGRLEFKCPPLVEVEFYGAPVDDNVVWERIAKLHFPLLLVYAADGDRNPKSPETVRFLELTKGRFELCPGTHLTTLEHEDWHANKILELAAEWQKAGRLKQHPLQ